MLNYFVHSWIALTCKRREKSGLSFALPVLRLSTCESVNMLEYFNFFPGTCWNLARDVEMTLKVKIKIGSLLSHIQVEGKDKRMRA